MKYLTLVSLLLSFFCSNGQVGPIIGATNLCSGSSTTLSDTTSGGTWSSSAPGIATVGSSSGIVNGVGAGVAIITYTTGSGFVTTLLTVNSLPAPITGPVTACVSTTVSETDATPGGTWTSSTPAISTINPVTGIVTPISPGVASISYTLSTGCSSSILLTVNATPSITGSSSICLGTLTTLSALPGGGTWSSGSPSIATITMGGTVTGVATGTAYISYTLTTGCLSTLPVSVYPTPAPITGTTSMCAGSGTTLSDATGGGTWSSSSTSIAIVSLGAVSGVSPGTALIYYTLPSTGCYASATVTVNAPPSPIAGASSLCAGNSTGLSSGTSGGWWSSSNPSVATVGSASGLVTGVSAGTANIYYTIATGCSNSRTITVNSSPTAFAMSPATGSYCAGGPGITVSLAGSQAGVSYQLFLGSTAVGGPVSGTGSSLNFGIQTAPGTYSVIATNSTTGCMRSIGSTVISINLLPVSYSVTGGGAYCPGAAGVHVGLSSSQSGVNYQLYAGGAPVGSSVSGTGMAIDFGVVGATGTYTVNGVNAVSGCVNNMTGSTTISMSTAPNVYAMNGSSAYCAGGGGSHVGLLNSDAGVSYQLYRGVTPVGTPILGSGAPLDFGLETVAGIYNVIGTDMVTTCSTAMGSNDTISINPLPSVYAISGGGTFCAGTLGHIMLAGSDIGVTYTLDSIGVPVATLTGVGSSLDFGLHGSGSYEIIATSVPGCTSSTGTASVVVNPLPNIFNLTATGPSAICPGNSVDIGLDGSQSGVNYKLWNGSSLVATVPGNGGSLDFGHQSTAGIYRITAINAVTGCNSNMTGSTNITVLTAPASYSMVGGGSYCAGGTGVHVGVSSSQTGVSYQLFNGGIATGVPVSGTGTAIDFGMQTSAGAYAVTGTHTITGCATNMSGTAVVAVNPLPAVYTMTGGGSYCIGSAGVHIGLSGSQTGTSYTVYNGTTAIGIVSGTGGVLDLGLFSTTGAYTVVAKKISTGCTINMTGTVTVNVNPLPPVFNVMGGGSFCSGGTGVHVGLSNSTPGVNYYLYRGATLAGSLSGTGTALDFGLQTGAGTYIVTAVNATTGCVSYMSGSASVIVNPSVAPAIAISPLPNDTICGGTTVNFTAVSTNGGTTPAYQWKVNGVNVGTGMIYSYVPSAGDIVSLMMTSTAPCALPATVTALVNMNVVPNPTITGITSVCMGHTTVLTGPVGCNWQSGTPSVGLISTVGSSTGTVTSVSPGTTLITCTSSAGCSSSVTVTVNPVPVVSASSSAACGTTMLTASGAGSYYWIPTTGLSCPGCATTNATPSVSLTYTVTGTNGFGCTDTATVYVNEDRISGYISYAGTPTDSLKVWLIQFNATDSSLTAEDSTFTCMAGSNPYYEFMNKPAGNYMVKAKLLGQTIGASGYIPTYSVSTPYWYAAASVYHTNTADTLHIDMVYGTVPPGPGFIGGLISAGAGKGTTGDIPAQGMLVYLKDAISNFVISYTYTDAHGAYSFSNVGYGSYVVYPEEYVYHTVQSQVITLAPGSDSASGVNFKQYTTSKVIAPLMVNGVKAIAVNSGISVYPNPTTGLLNINWSKSIREDVQIIVTDALGREVYRSVANTGNRETQIDLGGLKSGMYLLTLKSESIYYSGKVMVK